MARRYPEPPVSLVVELPPGDAGRLLLESVDSGLTPSQILTRALRDWLSDKPRDSGPPLRKE
jgi:hypothetical protein